MIKILVFCLGNICRSPAAEVILRDKLIAAGYQEGLDFELDSAGTGSWHIGGAPDERSIAVCARHGLDSSHLRARQLETADGAYYDLILGMDESNLDNAKKIIAPEYHHKIQLFDKIEVRDPYFGISDGFEIMYQQLENASQVWVDEVRQKP